MYGESPIGDTGLTYPAPTSPPYCATCPWEPHEWIRTHDGLVSELGLDATTLGTMYERKPCGRLRMMQRDEHTLTVSNAGPVERVVVWTEKRLAHCLLEREAWDRAQLRGDSELQPGAEKPPEYVLGGALL